MIVHVPYHLDERLADDVLPMPGGWDVHTVEFEPSPGTRWQRMAELQDRVADAVAEAILDGAVPRVISGDCLVSSGVLTGIQRAGRHASVVWFDAHGDVHTSTSSTSGYPGGMALRLLLGADPDVLARPLGLRPLDEQQALLVDARDLDPAEVDYLATSEVRRLPVADVGPGVVPPGPIVLHIDVDVIDGRELRGLRFPVENGASSSSVLEAAGRIMAAGDVVAVHIACPWHPADGEDVETRSKLLAELVLPSSP